MAKVRDAANGYVDNVVVHAKKPRDIKVYATMQATDSFFDPDIKASPWTKAVASNSAAMEKNPWYCRTQVFCRGDIAGEGAGFL